MSILWHSSGGTRGAHLHTAQLMPLPLTVSCFSKIQIGFTCLVPAHPEKVPLNGCMYAILWHSATRLLPACGSCHVAVLQLTVLFFSRPRSEGWPHHGRTFSIYLCRLSFWLTLPRRVLSISWCCPSRPCVIFLACVPLALFLSPGNSLVSLCCDHSMLASLLWRRPQFPHYSRFTTRLFSLLSAKPAESRSAFIQWAVRPRAVCSSCCWWSWCLARRSWRRWSASTCCSRASSSPSRSSRPCSCWTSRSARPARTTCPRSSGERSSTRCRACCACSARSRRSAPTSTFHRHTASCCPSTTPTRR